MSQTVIKLIKDHNKVLKRLKPKEKKIADNVMINNLRVKPTEKILVVTDTEKAKQEGAFFFEAAKRHSKNITYIEMEPAMENAQEPPRKVAELMKQNDIVLLITRYSLSHTKAVKEASFAGSRIVSMPGITYEMIMRTLSINYDKIARLSKKIASILTQGNQALLKSKNGTNVFFSLEGRTGLTDTGLFTNPGDLGNLPAGEAFIAPVEGKTEGVIVFDGCFADVVLDKPIKVTVRKGMVKDIVGGEGARMLNERLSRVGKRGYNIAELGVGTNKETTLASGSILEIEKVYGTVHVALGNNAVIGGEVDVPFHSDGVILKPTLIIDDKIILQDGKFQL